MNKKIIAAAVAAAFVAGAPSAQAEIKAYSMVQFELTDFDRDGSGSDGTAVTDNQRGRFGFKGGHDLGGGLKSFAMVEFDFEGGNNDAEFGGRGNGTRIREANAGIKGAFGSIRLGTVKSAYKYLGGVKYDPYVATQLEQRGRGGMSAGQSGGHNAFLNNAFQYNIKAGIAKIHATLSLDDTDRDSGSENNDDGELSLGVAFGNKKWEAGAAYYDQGLSVSAENNESLKIFGKISFGTSTILAQIEDVETSSTENSDYIMLGYQLKVGKGMVSLYLGDRDSSVDANDSDNATLAYTHKFNKKSRVWVGYQTFDQTGTANDVDRFSLGIRVDI